MAGSSACSTRSGGQGFLTSALDSPSSVAAATSFGQPLGQHRLGLVGALLAFRLGTTEEPRELRVAVPVRILDVGLQAQCVAQALLGEPDQVVVLVLGTGDLPALAARHRATFLSGCQDLMVLPCGLDHYPSSPHRVDVNPPSQGGQQSELVRPAGDARESGIA